MDLSVGKTPVICKEGIDNSLIVLRDWNSYSPLLRKELRKHDNSESDYGPDERLGGGYFLVWKGHGVVIDPGVDFVTQLYRKGFSIADVDTVVVTPLSLGSHTGP